MNPFEQLNRELDELRAQVIETCEKYCGVRLSLCNTGEALSVIATRLKTGNEDRQTLEMITRLVSE